jgi:hypothetical protein
MLAELIETITDTMNASNTNVWGTYKVPGYVTAEKCLDPQTLMETKEKKLFIMPLVTNFEMGESLKRNKVQSISTTLVFGVTLLIPFQEFSKNDVSSWDEVKKVLELREKLDLFVIRQKWGDYTLDSVDPQPPVEIELSQRTFMSTTEFIYRTQVC